MIEKILYSDKIYLIFDDSIILSIIDCIKIDSKSYLTNALKLANQNKNKLILNEKILIECLEEIVEYIYNEWKSNKDISELLSYLNWEEDTRQRVHHKYNGLDNKYEEEFYKLIKDVVYY